MQERHTNQSKTITGIDIAYQTYINLLAIQLFQPSHIHTTAHIAAMPSDDNSPTVITIIQALAAFMNIMFNLKLLRCKRRNTLTSLNLRENGNDTCHFEERHIHIYIYINVCVYMSLLKVYMYTHTCIYICVCVYIHKYFEERHI